GSPRGLARVRAPPGAGVSLTKRSKSPTRDKRQTRSRRPVTSFHVSRRWAERSGYTRNVYYSASDRRQRQRRRAPRSEDAPGHGLETQTATRLRGRSLSSALELRRTGVAE